MAVFLILSKENPGGSYKVEGDIAAETIEKAWKIFYPNAKRSRSYFIYPIQDSAIYHSPGKRWHRFTVDEWTDYNG